MRANLTKFLLIAATFALPTAALAQGALPDPQVVAQSGAIQSLTAYAKQLATRDEQLSAQIKQLTAKVAALTKERGAKCPPQKSKPPTTARGK